MLDFLNKQETLFLQKHYIRILNTQEMLFLHTSTKKLWSKHKTKGINVDATPKSARETSFENVSEYTCMGLRVCKQHQRI